MLPCAVEIINVPSHSQLMHFIIISFAVFWLYYWLNVSKENEERIVISEGEKQTQYMNGEIMGHDECNIIFKKRRSWRYGEVITDFIHTNEAVII
jgi:hypothetical protein